MRHREWDPPVNTRVLSYLEGKSAHSDCAGALSAAVRPLGDTQQFCPDPAGYGYVVVSTLGIIFGFAVGADTIAFRLDARMRVRALATGGVPVPECGDAWVAVVHHQPDDDWPAVDLKFWARKSYVHARETLSRML
jgi:hypothetical protein